MKKLISMILAVILVMALACTAMAEENNGEKFDSCWAVPNAFVEIDQEDEGFRVLIIGTVPEEGRGTIWEYNCFYMEDLDSLVSMTTIKRGFTFDPEYTDLVEYEEPEREGFDDDDKSTVFSINENGHLIWEDGYENMGTGLEFVKIGFFNDAWKNEDEEVYAVFDWNGTEDEFYYDVYLQCGDSDADTCVIFYMIGIYNEETGKLECTGPAVTYANGADDGVSDGEIYEATFSWTDHGTILFEMDEGIGIELEQDFDNNG